MNVKVPLVLLLIMAAAIGYFVGTEKGRSRRQVVVGRIRDWRSTYETVDLTEPSPPTDAETEAAAAQT